MLSVLKFFMAFLISFTLLSIPVFDGRPLFYTLDRFLHPYTQKAISHTESLSRKYYRQGLSLLRKTFSNSVPTSAGSDRQESYSDKEIHQLENLLEEN